MTREEAIKEIKKRNCKGYKHEEVCQWAGEGFGSCEKCCYGLAMKALEQADVIIDEHYWKGFNNGVRTEKFRESKRQKLCEDCVSRKDVLAEITRFSTEEGASVQCQQLYCDINNMPSVTPKPKIGHWIRWYETIEQEHCTIHDPHCKCSECNQEYDPYIASLFNYCPNCGVKMEGAQE